METRPTTPTLYLYCWDNTEWLETTYAVIEITPAWAQAMCELVHEMAACRAISPPHRLLYQMEYWDMTPTWVIRPAAAEDPIDCLCDDIETNQAVYLAAGANAWTITDDDLQSVDCVTLCVQEDSIQWESSVRHADDTRLHTSEIPLRDLEHYARGEEPEDAIIIEYEPLEEERAEP